LNVQLNIPLGAQDGAPFAPAENYVFDIPHCSSNVLADVASVRGRAARFRNQ
jgi:hypothetical protein